MTKPLRAALYARYSSDLQNAASIDDQLRVCARLAKENGWTIVEEFSDAALSGATSLRPGFQRLIAAALAGNIDVVVAEGIDRLSRDQEHIASFYKRMQYNDVRIVTKSEGEINELHIGLGGTMSALYLRQLREKTHRGLEGRVRAGKAAGGLCYGYRLDRQPLADGSYTTGDRVIDETEARVIRQIFTDYAAGKSSRSIAIRLNAEGVASPRAGTWSFSTISGNWKRGTGILNNELYLGKLVWNRQRFRKDPVTQKRQACPNPPEEWIIEEVDHLRIVDEETWQRVKIRQGAVRDLILEARDDQPGATGLEHGRRSRYLFSGLLSCGCCGASYIMISDSRYGCSAARNSGTCTNRKTIGRTDVEARVLDGLRLRLMAPDLIATFIEEYRRETEQLRKEGSAERDQLSRRLVQLRREIDNIVTAIAGGMFHESMKARMDALEAERKLVEARLATLAEPEAIVLHPALSEVYRRKIDGLAEALTSPDRQGEASEALRSLIEKIILRPDASAANGHVVELYGELGAILSLCSDAEAPNAKARSGAPGVRQVAMVAGAGFEPAAFRL